jgi:hypothetical protein
LLYPALLQSPVLFSLSNLLEFFLNRIQSPSRPVRLFQPYKHSASGSNPVPTSPALLFPKLLFITSATPSGRLREISFVPDRRRVRVGSSLLAINSSTPKPGSLEPNPPFGFTSPNPSIPGRLNKVTGYSHHARGYDVSGYRSGLLQLNIGTLQCYTKRLGATTCCPKLGNKASSLPSECSTSPRKASGEERLAAIHFILETR